MHGIPETIWLEGIRAQLPQDNANIVKISHANKKSVSNDTYHVILSGKATNPKSVETFLESLNNIENLKEASISILDRRSRVWQFKIGCILNN